MKWPEALIIQNHQMCNLRCLHCQGSDAENKPIVLQTPEVLPQRISLTELKEVITFLDESSLIGKERITAIRFGGNWSEPTLDSELASKVEFLLNATTEIDCQIRVITNGINIPHQPYDPDLIGNYLFQHFGFSIFPSRFSLKISTDEEHLASYIKRRSLEAEVSPEQAIEEYKRKIANIVRYTQDQGIAQNIIFSAVAPTNAPVGFSEDVRRKFNIPDNSDLHILRRSIYTPLQTELPDAVDLTNSSEPPLNIEHCYFLAKRRGEIFLYPNIVSFGYDNNGVPYRDFKFPEVRDLEIAA